jgi:hypothetical protein
MTGIAAPLGILACLSMAGAAAGSAVAARHGSICYGGRDIPKEPAEAPKGCHATMSCAAHRKLRTFP